MPSPSEYSRSEYSRTLTPDQLRRVFGYVWQNKLTINRRLASGERLADIRSEIARDLGLTPAQVAEASRSFDRLLE